MLKGKPRTWIFVVASVVYVVIVVLAALRIDAPLSASEWGNVLAGVFSPLAFFWLLYTALAQRAELELQRLELEQTREELRRSADAQEKSEQTMRYQVDLQIRPYVKLRIEEHGSAWALIN